MDTTIGADVFAVYIPLYVILSKTDVKTSFVNMCCQAGSCAGIVHFQNARQQTILVSSIVRA